MAYASEDVQLGVTDVGSELVNRQWRNGAVGVAPDEKRWGGEGVSEKLVKGGHVLVPGGEQAQEMGHGAAGLEVFAVGLELGGSVPGFGTGHATQTHHLHPARIPREGIGE